MKFNLTNEEILDFDFLVNEFLFIKGDNEDGKYISDLLRAYKIGYNNMLILKFNDDIDYQLRCDWLLHYCENISVNINLSSSRVSVNESECEAFDENCKKILLIVDREFEQHIAKKMSYLSELKNVDDVIIKYSDKLSNCINTCGKVSLIEIILRIHELFKHFKINYIIINEFEKLIDHDYFQSNETKSIINSLLFSLIVNMNNIKSEDELKIIIIE